MARISRVLIANRGEIAVRIAKTLRAMTIEAVAIYHREDADSPLLDEVDEAIEIFGVSPVAAYLDQQALIQVCKQARVDALHPGYGFLAENADFCQALEEEAITFIGPSSGVIRLMGNKQRARDFVAAIGVPVAPSVYDDGTAAAHHRFAELGFPLLIKAAAGGGGRGMRIVRSTQELEPGLQAARREAARYFNDAQVYCERYIERPRHIEVQVLADAAGHCVHLGERDCSVQRRFQKIIEESPAPNLGAEQRADICSAAVAIAKAARYRGAGTVEFLLDADGRFYFLEMNTRLQVEHPVTEMVSGIDLVEEQVRIAAEEELRFSQEQIVLSGHAIECRICAEIPEENHLPATGRVALLRPPAGPGIRFDCGVREDQSVTAAFDPLLAKLVVHGSSRDQALRRMQGALQGLVLLGIQENSAYLRRVITHPRFQAGLVDTHLLEDLAAELLEGGGVEQDELVALLALAALADGAVRKAADDVPEPYAAMGHWRN